ncbi:MAG: IS66 family insertion sequence element accessory protein TnpA [Planctomyces sp.]
MEKEQRFERYAQSQVTVNQFCEWKGVSPAMFCNWRKKLAAGNLAERVSHLHTAGTPKFEDIFDQLDGGPAGSGEAGCFTAMTAESIVLVAARLSSLEATNSRGCHGFGAICERPPAYPA